MVTIALISYLSLIISFLYSFWVLIISSCGSKAFRCVTQWVIWDLSSFLMQVLSVMNLYLRTTFILSHRFWYVVFSFSFNSKKFLVSFLISVCLDPVFTQYWVVQCTWVCIFSISVVLLSSGQIRCKALSQFCCICWGLCSNMWSVLEKAPWAAKNEAFFF